MIEGYGLFQLLKLTPDLNQNDKYSVICTTHYLNKEKVKFYFDSKIFYIYLDHEYDIHLNLGLIFAHKCGHHGFDSKVLYKALSKTYRLTEASTSIPPS